MAESEPREEFDYVVVGSGAGGGPIAANLAKAGMSVLLLEAGTDAENYHYEVPCFHGLATEDPEYSWEFFVRHYADDHRQSLDSKFRPQQGGVFYPRAGTLGGCTAHNAMITVVPRSEDWDRIAELTGDESWRGTRMRRYFQRLERCRYARQPFADRRRGGIGALLRRIPVLSWLLGDRARHGFRGWLSTSLPDPKLALGDPELIDVLASAGRDGLAEHLGRPLTAIEDLALADPRAYVDPNAWSVQRTTGEGIWLAPLATRNGRRNGTREYLKQVQKRLPRNLTIRTGCLATRVLFEDGARAVGVEYLEGEHLYRADPRTAEPRGEPPRRAFARREVVVSGGAFNTPQLLKLSGIGPRAELDRFGIETLVDLPGVGENLQDRYEVGVVMKMKRPFTLLEGSTFDAPVQGGPPDPSFTLWRSGKGLYCTNGAVLGIIKKSAPERPLADLFVFGLPASFRGYSPGYSKQLEQRKDAFTWAILKAHTRNSAGRVTLRSKDPRDVPDVQFHYFDEGNDAEGEDLESVVDGVEFARRLMAHAEGFVDHEVVPGEAVKTREQLREFVRNEAWGHHASCTCKIGPASDPMAVLDGEFRVRGTRGLRVVDASVFPFIPGFFIVTAVYMVSEKATDVLLADATGGGRGRRGATRRLGARLRTGPAKRPSGRVDPAPRGTRSGKAV